MRVLLRASILLSLLFAGCIGIIRAQPYHVVLRDLLYSGDCQKPCWHGIRPGSTSVVEAILLLRADAWVLGDSIERIDRRLRWQWSGAQHELIDASEPGILIVSNEHVFAVHLPLKVGMGDLQLSFGRPNWSSQGRYRDEAFIQYAYPDEHLSLLLSVPCPMGRQSYWHTRPEITLSGGFIRGVNYRPQSPYLKLC